jgi:hypothetical protein
LLGILCLLILAALAPAGLRPGWAPSNFGDLYAYHVPMRHLTASALQAGRLPFWNPYIFSGLPLSANPQAALLYPLSVAGYIFPTVLALSWNFAFHLAWAACGWMLLARRQRMGSLGAFFLAAVYGLSPFLVYRVQEGIPTLLASLAWAPWVWLAWLCGGPALLAAAWSLQFLSGHPQFMVVNALGMTAWALLDRSRWALLRRMALAGTGTLLLTAAQWVPLKEFLGHSVRSGWPQAYTTAYSVDWRMLANWLYPDAWGNPLDATYAGPPSVFFETAGLYVGIWALGLACWGIFRGRGKQAAALVALGLFLSAGGHNPVYVALLNGPLGWLRTPARYLFLCLWGIVAAAATGWKAMEERLSPSALVLALAAAAAVLELAAWDRSYLAAQNSLPYLAPRTSVAEAIGGRNFRVMTDPDLASPNKTMLYRAMNVNGYEAFYLGGYPEYAARSEGRAAADASRTYLRRFDSPEMEHLGVRYFLDASGELKENPQALPLAYFLDGGGRPFKGALTIDIPRPERWRISGTVPDDARALIAALPSYPGWTARLDGFDAHNATWDGWLQSFKLPEDKQGARFELSLDFAPTGWPWLAGLTALMWSAWLGFAAGAVQEALAA